LFQQCAELKHLFSLVPILIAVSGRVWANRQINCELSENKGVMVSVRDENKSETKSENIWLTNSTPLREVIKETPWALVDGKGPFAVHLPVQDGRQAAGDYMQLSGDLFQPAADGLVDQVLGQLVGHKQLGIRRTERYLPSGTAITAIGELAAVVDHPGAFKGAYREDGKMLVLREPRTGPFILSRRSLEDLISSAQGVSAVCGNIAAFFITTGASMLLLSAYYTNEAKRRSNEFQRRIRDARESRRAAAAAAGENGGSSRPSQAAGNGGQQAPSNEANGDEERKGVCVACLERDSDMVFPGCGHLCVCRQCAAAGSNRLNRCPICRVYGKPIQVFLT
jgi:E3 Ubiquitin ligase/Zinc finger, C3HC4 type (RING finger)